jgi:hypothetical protein
MLQMDEAIAQTPLKDLAQVELVLGRIPTKTLYKLQVNFAQEVQSRTRTDVAKLQETKNVRDALELVVEQVKLETKEEKECADRMEHGVKVDYNCIPDNAQTSEKSAKEKINLIVQTINQYKQEIDELKKRLNPKTPLEVREEREQEFTLLIAEMEK